MPAAASAGSARHHVPFGSSLIFPNGPWSPRTEGLTRGGAVTGQSPSGAVRGAELAIGGMTCASCAARIEKKLNRLDGVSRDGQPRHRDRAT